MRRTLIRTGMVALAGLGLSGFGTAAAEVSPMLDLEFTALVGDRQTVPPNTHGAVGFDEVVTVVRSVPLAGDGGTIQFHNKIDGSPVGAPVTLKSFWAPVASTTFVFDPKPRVVFDPDPAYGGRWIWAMVNDFAGDAGLLIGASADTSLDPGEGLLIDADPGDVLSIDDPSVGFNKNWVVVQVNVLNGGAFQSTRIYVFDKAHLYAGTTGTCQPAPTLTGCTLIESATIGAEQVPAATYDFSVEELYLLQRWNSAAGQLRLYRIEGPVGSESIVQVGTPVSPPWADTAPGGLDFAPQNPGPPGCGTGGGCVGSCKIQTGDSRIQNVVYRNGSLWATHTVFLPYDAPTRSSVQWWQIDTAGNRLQGGLVDDPSGPSHRFYAYPSIAVNQYEDVLLGFSSFHENDWAGARYAFRYGSDPPGTLRTDEVLKAGEACYFKDPFTEGLNRWGQYSATVVDPSDHTRLWTVQEYAETPNSTEPVALWKDMWGTHWGRLDPLPSLSVGDASVNEGDSGTTSLVFEVTLSRSLGSDVTVNWSTADGTATAGTDYTAKADVLTIPAGLTTGQITVDVNGDLQYEMDDTLFVDLATPVGADLSDAQGQGVILNDDATLPLISIADVTMREGDTGQTQFVFKVTLSRSSAASVQCPWVIVPGSATPDVDYTDQSGTVVFPASSVYQEIIIDVLGDTVTPEIDETFTVLLIGPAVGGLIVNGNGVGTILDDDAPEPDALGFSIVADSTGAGASDGRLRAQWLHPVDTPNGFVLNWNDGNGCSPPSAHDDATADGTLGDPGPIAAGTSVTRERSGLPLGQDVCFALWLRYSSGVSSGLSLKARPFDSTGDLKWKLFSMNTALAQPTVGFDAVVTPANDGYVHAMTRGPAGGIWPPLWKTPTLGDISQQRAPVIPLTAASMVFISTQNGLAQAIDTSDGSKAWTVHLTPPKSGGSPAGIFAKWGGPADYVFVGTKESGGNAVYALDPLTGAVIDRWPQAHDGTYDLGAVGGSFTVDYGNNLIYFGSWGTATTPETLWCLEVGPPSDALRLRWKSAAPGNVTGSAVTRGDRVYVGDDAAQIWAVEALSGGLAYSRTVDADLKGFVFPDRNGGKNIYFSTIDSVWALEDTGAALIDVWSPNRVDLVSMKPSVLLFWPGTDYLYVGADNIGGSGNSGVIQIDITTPHAPLTYRALDPSPLVIGPPALDVGNGLLHVGSVAGILYAVAAPFIP